MAGEGVEYSWDISKGVYRQKPLHSKKSKESFRKLVNDVTSSELLRTETVRKLSRQPQAHSCPYYLLYESKNKRDDTTKLTLPLIKRLLVKAFKARRAAIDFDASFVYGLCLH